jgi:transposase
VPLLGHVRGDPVILVARVTAKYWIMSAEPPGRDLRPPRRRSLAPDALRLGRRRGRPLDPVYEHLKASVLSSNVVHTDDTQAPVLDPDRRTTRAGHLWVYVGDQVPADLVYAYTPTRGRAGLAAFLGDFRGYLQADTYGGYDALYATGRVVEVECWAPAHRYFFESKGVDTSRAVARARLHPRPVRRGERRENARCDGAAVPSATACHADHRAVPDVARRARRHRFPKSPIGEAVTYARKQWTALTRYLEDADIAIDNNVSECAFRKIGVGRANWLFCGNDESGRRAAILYSIVGT